MAGTIDPEALRRQPRRALKEIAADILYFPMEKPAGVDFDSSMRVPEGEKTIDSFGSNLQTRIDHAPYALHEVGRSLLQRLTDGRVPRKLQPEVQETSEKTLAHSTKAMRQLKMSLRHIMENDSAENTDKAVIQAVAYPIVELMARSDMETAEYTRKTSSDGAARGIAAFIASDTGEDAGKVCKALENQDTAAAAHFENAARNLRGGVMPLLDELADALNITLNKQNITLNKQIAKS